ncbi:MAG: ABC transporter permease [Oscillospiraceae bacterium]|nr:ABC transporter permease [Oscillospiraceae bacterium]
MENKEIIIKPSSSLFSINLKEIWDYRDLLKMLIEKNLKLVYKQTILGPAWMVINPILTSIIFTFVFGSFAGISTDGVPPFLFYVAGNTIWGLFNTAVTNTSNTFVNNQAVFTKIYFPRLVTPLAMVINSAINFLIQLAALMVFFVVYMITGTGVSFHIRMLLVIPLVVQTCMLALGVGLISSCLGAKYRDFRYIITLVMNLWMYVTPVVYPMSLTGGWMNFILTLNPMTPIVSNFKWAFLGSGYFMGGSWVLSIVITVAILFLGIVWYSKVERTFADTV